ncbi:bifunctional phosphopantothenoylcysteine decarboxylase/phosphopantothenate--cysteine ligase CoaBC [Longirhabdus pacifica]|uniref:bifunctional phosphopantothenoylcysteine decarboxylase/phosphopantothenate--cysteine ligase CoaBC n=1 Tax=Longirhabdus pacifica TaxID=2305227 RepID=UPI0010089178|nr:bifunctional phosphopantothenoylcysteine decarboxylase/phosphopantothenate--cysteine ligase CoaBC [Longirhabdus pacifica]
MVKGKSIILGISGGIASYKGITLCSTLVQAGADVQVIMTNSASKFIEPLTFQTISRNPVYIDTFNETNPKVVSHIDAADKADLVIIAPATANILAKMTHGIADDMLSTTLLAVTCPIVIAPAMNVNMYAHPAVQQNMQTLLDRGVQFIDPNEGQLACGYVGKGRMAEPEQIFNYVQDMLASSMQNSQKLKGKKVLITAGGTRERIDPVRYIANDSSGKMGIALAEQARDQGADVTFIHGHMTEPCPTGVQSIFTSSSKEMYDAVNEHFSHTDILVMAAAVSDYRPINVEEQKIKKKSDQWDIALQKTEDILQHMGKRKTNQFIVGFAAETENGDVHAQDKLKRKHCDLIVLNDVTVPGAGFSSNTNIVKVFNEDGMIADLPMMSKKQVAAELMSIISDTLIDEGK